jgi:hypothetical protein
MARHRSLRSELYRDARILGNIEAATKGPGAYAKRYVRRKVYSRSMGLSNSILKSINMMK